MEKCPSRWVTTSGVAHRGGGPNTAVNVAASQQKPRINCGWFYKNICSLFWRMQTKCMYDGLVLFYVHITNYQRQLNETITTTSLSNVEWIQHYICYKSVIQQHMIHTTLDLLQECNSIIYDKCNIRFVTRVYFYIIWHMQH